MDGVSLSEDGQIMWMECLSPSKQIRWMKRTNQGLFKNLYVTKISFHCVYV